MERQRRQRGGSPEGGKEGIPGPPQGPLSHPELRPLTLALLGTFDLNGRPGMCEANITPGWLLTSPFLAAGTPHPHEASGTLQCLPPDTGSPKVSAQILACFSHCLWLRASKNAQHPLLQAPISPHLV